MRPPARPALVRLARILQEARAGHWPNASTLAKSLEVTPRTIQRDLDYLRDQLGAPLEYDAKHRGYAITDASYSLPAVTISEGECLALFLAQRLLEQYRGLPFAADVRRLFNKITSLLPEPVTIDLEQLAPCCEVRLNPADAGQADHFRRLVRAVQRRRQVELLYWSASRDQTLRRRVDPYHLACLEGDWYCVGFCHLREETRLFMLGRIRELQETGATFERPMDFNVNDYLDAGFRRMRGDGPLLSVRLRFSAAVARYIRERTWHPKQTLCELPDGRLELAFAVNHLLEVKRWAMSFGSECEVVEPVALREGIVEEARRMCGKGAARIPSKRRMASSKSRRVSNDARSRA